MPDLELATAVILDPDNKMLVAHRADHSQWELPGGKLLPEDEGNYPLALQRALQQKFDIETDPTDLVEIGSDTFTQHGTEYDVRWHQVKRYSGLLALDESLYDAYDFVSPLSRNFLRKPLSRNIRNLQRALLYGKVSLEFISKNPVQ